jgi:hypothetical protein
MIVFMIKNILERGLGLIKFSWYGVPHFVSPGHKTIRAEASKETLQLLQESEGNHFDGIATGDESSC